MKKVLIIDDDEINRSILHEGLSDLFTVIEAVDGQEGLDLVFASNDISAVLLDLNMPRLNGYEVLRKLKTTEKLKYFPVFIITASSDTDRQLEAYDLGAYDILSKPYNIKFLRRRITNSIELYEQRSNLQQLVDEKTAELVRQNNRLVEAMADMVEFRNNESGLHVQRVKGYTKILMEALIKEYPEFNHLKPDIERISFAACLHDLGKIQIPDSILTKPGPLTQEEKALMQSHTERGYEQLKALQDIIEPCLLSYCLDISRHHHERYDGEGYPDKLSGENISIWSQVVALADVYDALTNERIYKQAYDHDTACKMIFNGECGQFNPKVMKVFETYKHQCNKYRIQMQNEGPINKLCKASVIPSIED